MALKDVKLGELGSYWARRNKTPGAVVSEMGRLHHYWQFRFAKARYNGTTPYYQLAAFWVIVFAIFNIDKQSKLTPHSSSSDRTPPGSILLQCPPEQEISFS